MAFTLNTTFRGASLPDAHLEIVGVALFRQKGMAHIYYRIYANRAACLADQDGNLLEVRELVVPFAQLAPTLGNFYNALQAKLLELFPAAEAATDAITFQPSP